MPQLLIQRFFLFLGILTCTQPGQNVPWHRGFSGSAPWPSDKGGAARLGCRAPRTIPLAQKAPVAPSGAPEQVLLLLRPGGRELFIRNQCLVNHSSCLVDRGQALHLRTNEANTFLPLRALCYVLRAPPALTECPRRSTGVRVLPPCAFIKRPLRIGTSPGT